MALGDEEVVHVHHPAALLHPNLAEVTAVFAFAILDGLQEHFLFPDDTAQEISSSTAPAVAAATQLRRIDTV